MSLKLWSMPFVFLLLTITGCSDHDDITFTELQVTATQDPVPVGFQTQLTATAFYSDGHSTNIDAEWESLDSKIATVNAYGNVSSVSPGQVTITATTTQGTGSFLLTVTSATLTAIELNPIDPERAVGLNVNYNAMGHFSDHTNHIINGHPDLVWESTDEKVAIINQDTGTSDTKSEGQTIITAVFQANDELQQVEVVSNDSTLTVTSHELQTILISPDRVTWPLGLIQQFTAEAILSDGSTVTVTEDVTWSSDPSGILEQVENEIGVFKGVELGSSNVFATYNGLESDNKAAFVVEHMEIVHFTIESGTDENSQPLGKEVQFKALAEFTDGNTYNVSGYKQVHWQSSNPDTATVTLSGLVEGVEKGFVTITATTDYEGVVAKQEIEITSREIETIVVQPIDENSIISVDNTQQFEAYGRYTDDTLAEYIEASDEFSWSVSTGLQPPHSSEYYTAPEATIDDSGELTYDSTGELAGLAYVEINYNGLTATTIVALPKPEVILVTTLSSVAEFTGVLTQNEARQLNIEYSDYAADGVNNLENYITMTNDEANLYCTGLLYNGEDDWRLPSSEELISLWTQEDGEPDDNRAFEKGWVYLENYWTTTVSEDGHEVISLFNGQVSTVNNDSLHYASCVRDRD